MSYILLWSFIKAYIKYMYIFIASYYYKYNSQNVWIRMSYIYIL